VYELSPVGLELEQTLLELGKWGSQFVPASPDEAAVLRLGSYALTLKTFFRPELAQGVDETYELQVGQEVLQVWVKEGQIEVQQGQALRPDAVFRTDMGTYLGLLQRKIEPEEAMARGLVRVEGDPTALDRFLDMCALPGPN
jgi:hypothetical protein